MRWIPRRGCLVLGALVLLACAAWVARGLGWPQRLWETELQRRVRVDALPATCIVSDSRMPEATGEPWAPPRWPSPVTDDYARRVGRKRWVLLGASMAACGQVPLWPKRRVPKHGWAEPKHLRKTTFGLETDTSGWTTLLDRLRGGRTGERVNVRVEDVVNAMPYRFAQPPSGRLVQVQSQSMPAPWDDDVHLLQIGLQARTVAERRPVHLTVLVDVSWHPLNRKRLGLLRPALHEVVGRLAPGDTVALVSFSDEVRCVLPPTDARDAAVLHVAIDTLQPEGSGELGMGLELAYEFAERAFRPGHENRVLLTGNSTDEVSPRHYAHLAAQVAARAREGIPLSTLSFGMKPADPDATLVRLAADGGGTHHFVADAEEARQALGGSVLGFLPVVAGGVEVEVAFDAEVVETYRLLGHERLVQAGGESRRDRTDLVSGQQISAI